MKEFKDVRDDYDELEIWKNEFIRLVNLMGIDLTDVYEDDDYVISFEIWENKFEKKYYEFNWFKENYCLDELTNALLIEKLLVSLYE